MCDDSNLPIVTIDWRAPDIDIVELLNVVRNMRVTNPLATRGPTHGMPGSCSWRDEGSRTLLIFYSREEPDAESIELGQNLQRRSCSTIIATGTFNGIGGSWWVRYDDDYVNDPPYVKNGESSTTIVV